jgi:hypothetical protein
MTTNNNKKEKPEIKIDTILSVLIQEWNHTIGEAKTCLEGEKEIIKHTILITLTVFASILYFFSSDKLDINEKLAFSPFFILILAIYLGLTIYSFSQTFYRYMISRYWIEELFPKIEKLLISSTSLKTQIKNISPKKSSSTHLLRWQNFYRENSSKKMIFALIGYRGIPLFWGLFFSIIYLIYLLMNYNNSCLSIYFPVWIQLALCLVVLFSFIILFSILLWGTKKMLIQLSK